MVKGFITITTDIRLCVQQAPFCKIVAISADQEVAAAMQQIKGINASILTPPYEAAVFDIDGDVQRFRSAYYDYLSSQLPGEFIALVLMAIYSGKNVIFYLTPSESELMYSKVLLEFLAFQFGIRVGTDPSNFGIDPNLEMNIYQLLIAHQLISADEFIMEWRRYPMFIPGDNTIVALAMMQRPYLGNNQPTFQMIKQYYLSLIQSSQRVLPSAVSSSLIN